MRAGEQPNPTLQPTSGAGKCRPASKALEQIGPPMPSLSLGYLPSTFHESAERPGSAAALRRSCLGTISVAVRCNRLCSSRVKWPFARRFAASTRHSHFTEFVP